MPRLRPAPKPPVKEQVKTFACSAEAIMRHPHFANGLDDIRAGRPFADHIADEYWGYERGRLFGAIAPLSMKLFVGGRLNRKAVALFHAAIKRKYIP
jgi:hypothetical protein